MKRALGILALWLALMLLVAFHAAQAQSVRISGPVSDTSGKYRLLVTYVTAGGNIVSNRVVSARANNANCRTELVPQTGYGRHIYVIGAAPGTCEITATATVNRKTYTSPVWPVTVTQETRFRVRTGSVVGPPPPLPAPAPDSSLVIAGLRLWPDSVSLKPGETVTFCPFIRFADGKVARRTQDASPCDGPYPGLYTATQRAVSAAQQARADSLCLVWQVSGGTLAPRGGCDTVVP